MKNISLSAVFFALALPGIAFAQQADQSSKTAAPSSRVEMPQVSDLSNCFYGSSIYSMGSVIKMTDGHDYSCENTTPSVNGVSSGPATWKIVM